MSSTLIQIARDKEFELRQAIEKHDVFFEVNLDHDEIRWVQELYGRLAAHELRGVTYEWFINAYPALTLTTLVGHAGLSYEQGRYWESFWEELDLDQDPQFEAALRHSLAGLLHKLRLRELPDLDGNYVMVMALHAGIPVHCIGDLVDVIEDHVRHGRDPKGATLLEWLTAPGMEYRLGRLDVPVRNFLSYGGDVVVDILDRIIELLLFTLEQPDVWNNLELDTATTGLPRLMLHGLIERLQQRPFLSATPHASRTVLKRRSPLLSYAAAEDEVRISVPYPESSPEVPWKVSAAGVTREVYAERAWGVGDDDQPPTTVAVTTPAREVSAVHDPSGEQFVTTLFNSTEPLLLFTVDGRYIQPRGALPRGRVLALYPKDARVIDANSRKALPSVDDVRVPSGWLGWGLHTHDLTTCDAIRINRNTSDGIVRVVRSRQAPTFHLPEPAVGFHTANGLAVYAERPEVGLPASRAESLAWTVRTRRVGDRNWLTDCEWLADTEVVYLDPFAGVDEALLGLYEIVVSGSLGSDQRYQVFMAEGIGTRGGVALRLPAPGGLTPTVAEIVSRRGLPVEPVAVQCSADAREVQIRVGPSAHRYQLTVRPPHFEFRIDALGTPAQWRTAAVAITPGDLEEHRVVAVRAAGQSGLSIALIDRKGAVLQRERADRRPDYVFDVRTRRFVDTARSVSGCRLVAIVRTPAGVEEHIVLAEIRPARLCGAIDLVGSEIVFGDLADLDDLAAWVWSATAPWRPVIHLEIRSGRAELPEGLRAAGDLIVQVYVDDPFSLIARPAKPDATALRISQPGWLSDENSALDQLAGYLAGVEAPPLVPEAAGGAWTALAVLPWDRTDAEAERLRGGLVRVIGKHPRASLEALGNSVLSQDDMMGHLITTQLIERPYATNCTANDLHQNAWVGCMVEIADLPSLYDRRESVAGERAETLAYLETQGGTELINLLQSGTMADPRPGIFTRDARRLALMGEDQVAEIFERARIVPGAALDADTRTAAAIDAFNKRMEWVDDPISRELPGHVSRIIQALKKVSPVMYDVVTQRNEVLDGADCGEHPWLLLPMQSFALAAAARLEARAEFEYSPITADARRAWTVMAEYFPRMVATDLLIAEALTSHLEHGDLIGDSA